MTRVTSWFLVSRKQLSNRLELSRLRMRFDKPNRSIVALAWLTLRSAQLPSTKLAHILVGLVGHCHAGTLKGSCYTFPQSTE
jgi:hypothetical protein